ncbi:MAG TPA: ATP-binding protein [Phycisphaerales bacterium]|nr:ATP-binding protein [Phycisphaerales bacterium]
MHALVVRQLKRAGLASDSPPASAEAWSSFLEAVARAYEQADHDRYLLERSLALSSDEMGQLYQQLAGERDTISAVICSLIEGVCAVDENGSILFINPEACRLLQVPAAEARPGRMLAELVHARTADGQPLAQVLGAGASPERTSEGARLLVLGAEDRVVTFTVTPLGEKQRGAVLTLRDFTERHRLETERAELNRQLLEVSHQAGMAEVASGVLHNVGNVLNSVNVSATLTEEAVRGSRCGRVTQIADLLRSNAGRLPEFLGADPAGSRIIEYLPELGRSLQQERDVVLQELSNLRKSIEHIREIVAMQQTYAKVSPVREREDLAALADDAIRITEAALIRHGVKVVREYRPAPPIRVERHQMLQVLVNLLTNSKQALSETPGGERRLTIRVEPRGVNVCVRVSDNGCGIAPENLRRVFCHGFTTRRDGHGFGLHTAALAIKAMGGTIGAASAGPGQGAEFTIEIPADTGVERTAA